MCKAYSVAFALIAMLLLGTARSRAQVPASQPAEQTVGGRVLDVAGKPLSGATVVVDVTDYQGNHLQSPVVPSDAEGKFSLNIPVIKSTTDGSTIPFRYFAFKDGIGFSNSAVTDAAPLELQLNASVDLPVTFVAADGKPIVGVKVYLASISGRTALDPMDYLYLPLHDTLPDRFAAVTDNDGRCVFHDIPRGAQVYLDTDDERFARISGSESVDMSHLSPKAPATVHLHAAASISGHVINPETGKPMPGIPVMAEATRANIAAGYSKAVSDSTGAFQIGRINPGAYYLALGDENLADWSAVAIPVTVTEGQNNPADLTLTRGGWIKGTVMDVANNKPIAGVGFGVMGPAKPSDGGHDQVAYSDAQGNFTFRVPAGKQEVITSFPVAPGYLDPETRDFQPEVQDGQTAEVKVELTPDNSPSLDGIVVDSDGKPLAGARIVYNCPVPNGHMMNEGEVYTRADASGHFHIPQAKDKAEIRARWHDLATPAAMHVAHPGDEVRVEVKPDATFTLQVQVTDESGAPIPTAQIHLLEWTSLIRHDFPLPPPDDQGKSTGQSLHLDSKYSISAQAEGYGISGMNLRNPTGSPRGQSVTMKLKKATSQIAGIVSDENGTPLANIQVQIRGQKTGSKSTTTDAQGHFSFPVTDDTKNATVFLAPVSGMAESTVQADAGTTDLQLAQHPDRSGGK